MGVLREHEVGEAVHDGHGLGAGFGALLALLYAMLFGLLGAEDYALLMGSLLVFGVLGSVMVLTRKLDWYGVGRSAPQA